jgi:hypothetical protein
VQAGAAGRRAGGIGGMPMPRILGPAIPGPARQLFEAHGKAVETRSIKRGVGSLTILMRVADLKFHIIRRDVSDQI